MSQNDMVMDHLSRFGRIDPMEALSKLGVFRLSARVYDLRRQGHKITTRTVHVLNRFGEACEVAEYRLDGRAPE